MPTQTKASTNQKLLVEVRDFIESHAYRHAYMQSTHSGCCRNCDRKRQETLVCVRCKTPYLEGYFDVCDPTAEKLLKALEFV